MQNNKILYVSDLDGTLLNSNQTISDFTAQVINNLVEKGMIFTYATARSTYMPVLKLRQLKLIFRLLFITEYL